MHRELYLTHSPISELSDVSEEVLMSGVMLACRLQGSGAVEAQDLGQPGVLGLQGVGRIADLLT